MALVTSSELRAGALEIADRLVPVSPDLAITLSAGAISWDEPDGVLPALRHIAEISDRPLLAGTAFVVVSANLSRVLDRLDPVVVWPVARALLDTGSTAAAWIALALVQVTGGTAGWTEPWPT